MMARRNQEFTTQDAQIFEHIANNWLFSSPSSFGTHLDQQCAK
jgi:hypothetical protein